jgi:hypothetical protein
MNITLYDTGKKPCCQFQKQNETAKLESSNAAPKRGGRSVYLTPAEMFALLPF